MRENDITPFWPEHQSWLDHFFTEPSDADLQQRLFDIGYNVNTDSLPLFSLSGEANGRVYPMFCRSGGSIKTVLPFRYGKLTLVVYPCVLHKVSELINAKFQIYWTTIGKEPSPRRLQNSQDSCSNPKQGGGIHYYIQQHQ